jgi:hypothetical protein
MSHAKKTRHLYEISMLSAAKKQEEKQQEQQEEKEKKDKKQKLIEEVEDYDSDIDYEQYYPVKITSLKQARYEMAMEISKKHDIMKVQHEEQEKKIKKMIEENKNLLKWLREKHQQQIDASFELNRKKIEELDKIEEEYKLKKDKLKKQKEEQEQKRKEQQKINENK